MSAKETVSCTWVVENFSSVQNLVSKAFNHHSNLRQNFTLQLFPNNNKAGWSDYISISLATNVTGNINYTISLIDSNGEKRFSKDMSGSYKNSCQHGCHYYVLRSFLQNPTNGLLNDNKLTIHCEVKTKINNYEQVRVLESANPTSSKISIEKNQSEKNNGESAKLAEDYHSLLESGKFSDAVLVIGEKQFQVHKAILATRSPVFASMFEHECKEKLTNRIELTDIEVEVCEELLRYIYTGKIDLLKEYALELFIAADKYQLDSLKNICGKFLSSSMSIETVSKVLAYADMHNEAELKSKCIGFITENCTKVMKTDGWKQLGKTRPELLMELYQDMATKAQPFLKSK